MKIKQALRGLMSHKEYEANLAGMNIFFGAIIGVVMADVRGINGFDYAIMLLMAASFVVTLLYITASKSRVTYAFAAGAILAIGWYYAFNGGFMEGLDPEWLKNRLLPTGSVWYLMILLIEFMPRGLSDDDTQSPTARG